VTAQMNPLDALELSARRLHRIVGTLDDATIVRPAYPAEWTIAQVMSHLGSGAAIGRRRLEDELAGRVTPDDIAPQVWDDWNAKSARAQVDDGLVADAALVSALGALDDEERARIDVAMGPLRFGFDGLVHLRLNEHAVHTWDIEVALDDSATIPVEVAALVVDNLELIARFTARATPGAPATVTIGTSDVERRFTLELTDEGASLVPSVDTTSDRDVVLPAEAFARLVYGRLDPTHMPPVNGDPELIDRIRATFPGP